MKTKSEAVRSAGGALVLLTLILAAWPPGLRAVTVDGVVDAAAASDGASAKSQENVDVLSDDIDTLAAEYRAALQTTRALDVYNRQLESLIVSQKDEAESLQRQIDDVTLVSRQIMPLMVRMIDTLEKFVALDVPFLPEERSNRLAELRTMMARADVTIAEKYRRLLEAYQIENEYGRTIEAYGGELESGGTTRTVDFLRVGRNVLLYQTLDGRESGAWDQNERTWVTLSGYRIPIQQGIRMARRQVPPNLIRVPMPAAEAIR